MSTESRSSAGEPSGSRHLPVPEPLSAERLAQVPGVLGRIAAERSGDYCRAVVDDTMRDRQVRPSFERALLAAAGGARDATAGATPLAVIAEVKRASPSQGAIAALDPVEAAAAYAAGGAAALSVLTEPRHFGGDAEHLRAIAWAPNSRHLPLLRKDFTVHPAQIAEAAAIGASAVLLIVAVMREETGAYLRYATALGLDALVEVHDGAELELALDAGARIVGVNNRDLRTLAIDLATAPRLLADARRAGFDGVLVAESGYRTRDDLRGVEGLADAVLVGTSLAGSGDLTGALRTLRGVAR